MESMENNEFDYQAKNNGGVGLKEDLKEDLNAIKGKVAERASGFKDKVSDMAEEKINDVRNKASAGLKATSTRIQNLATYVDEHDAADMSKTVAKTSREFVREHPGQSMLVGVVVGLLVGRLLSFGNGNTGHHYRRPQYHPYMY